MRHVLLGAAGWIAALALLAPAGQAAAARIVVDDDRELRAAVQRLAGPGGIIVMRPGRYASVTVGSRSSRRLTIFAHGASTRYLQLLGTRNVRIVGLRVGSALAPASRGRASRSRAR